MQSLYLKTHIVDVELTPIRNMYIQQAKCSIEYATVFEKPVQPEKAIKD